MDNPILVEVTRGGVAESRHRGAAVVVDAAGGVVFSVGDVSQAVFPRSAVKALQALPLVETGAAERYRLTDAELALACASHAGEPGHVDTAAGMLAKAGRDVSVLGCGAHWPGDKPGHDLARAGGAPTPLHNNCSGKHAGFVCLACGQGQDPVGYVAADHPVQKAVRRSLEETTGAALAEAACGTDGCSIPTYAVPLTALARAFAAFGTGEGWHADRAAAAARIRQAVAASPWHVGGTGKLDTALMELFGPRLFCKTGAEGVYCASLPDQGLGIALKCEDGAGRAAQVMLTTLVARFLPMSAAEEVAMEPHLRPRLSNWNGIHVGDVRAVF